jgi:DNA-directed RNA polymerase subunit E'/Rpb7
MFSVLQTLRVVVLFRHHEMKELNSAEYVLNRVRQSYEYKCFPGQGLLVMVLGRTMKMGDIKVEKDWCAVEVALSAIFFKRIFAPIQPKRETS